MVLVALAIAGCATRLSSLTFSGAEIEVGDRFTIPTDSVLFINRGYIDSIKPSSKGLNQLRDGIDYDGYHEKPKAEIPAGTEVTIHEIYRTRKGWIYVTALFDGEKVDISRFIRPNGSNKTE